MRLRNSGVARARAVLEKTVLGVAIGRRSAVRQPPSSNVSIAAVFGHLDLTAPTAQAFQWNGMGENFPFEFVNSARG